MPTTTNSQGADTAEEVALGGRPLETSFLGTLLKLLQENVRDYGMFIALFLIMAVFGVATKGLFISSRNITNLINQTGYIAVLAIGMTLVIVIRHIDLSVGSLAGFIGAVAAWALVYWSFPVYAAIPLVLAIGVAAGLATAFLVAQMKIPAFVATLAGWLGYQGALQLVTVSTGTIIIPDPVFNALSNGFIPDIPHLGILPGVHKLTLILGLAAIVLVILGQINDRRRTQAYHFEVLPLEFFVLKLAFITVLIGGITWVMAGYQGLSWTAVIILLVVLAYNFVMSETDLGRHIYAVGGNPEAAQLSGISVKKITYMVFCSMGGLAALSGILFASRLHSATTVAGTGFELDAIAAAFVGGAAVSGGVGNVVGSVIGALVMASLTNGMNLLGIDISLQYIARALVLAVAVIFDVTTRNRAK